MQPLYPGRVASAHETIDPNALVHNTMTRSESVAGPRACPTTATLPVPGPDDLGERASACPLAEWRKPVRKMQFLGHVPGRRRGVHLGGAMVDTNDFGVVDTNDFGVEEDRIRAAYGRRRDDGRYAWSNPALLFIMQDLERRVLRLLAREGVLPLHDKHILEVGCGTGYWLRQFVKWGADPVAVTGVDLLPDRIAAARKLCPVGMRLFSGNAADLPLPDSSFDVAALFTVFTSILDPELKRQVARETLRVLKPRGLLVWYDFHVASPQNPDVKAIGKNEITELFPGCSIALERVMLAPPIARLVAPRSWLLCTLLETIPLLRTHYLGAIRAIRTP